MNVWKAGLFILPILLILSPVHASATATNSTCVDSSNSEINSTIVTLQNNVQNTTVISQVKYCDFGCNLGTGYCDQTNVADTGLVGTMVPVIVTLGLWAMGLLWKINRPWDIFYRIIFVFFGLFIAVSSVGIVNGIFSLVPNIPAAIITLATNNVLYMTWLQWLVTGAFVLFMITEVILWYRNMLAEAEGKRSGKYFMEGKEP